MERNLLLWEQFFSFKCRSPIEKNGKKGNSRVISPCAEISNLKLLAVAGPNKFNSSVVSSIYLNNRGCI